MKKTYISPNILVVRLGMTRPLATSTLGLTSDETLDTGDILTKEVATDVNVWDDEW